jgi:biopolymer transport protein ExbB/biopolymer transport protein TolQ
VGLSLFSINVIVDRTIFFARRRFDLQRFTDQLLSLLREGSMEEAAEMLARHRSVEAAVFARCLPWLEDGSESMQEILEAALVERRPTIEKGTLFLGTLGNNAPFVGLLGTVLGVVNAFSELGDAGAEGMDKVMDGIATALVATAAGIFVAMPAVVAYNIFAKKAAKVEENAYALLHAVLAHQKSVRETKRLSNALEGKGD